MSLTAHVSRRLAAWLTVLGALAVTVLVFLLPVPDPVAGGSSSGLSEDTQSVQVERLREQLPSADVDAALVVASRPDGGGLGPADLEGVTAATRAVADQAVGGQVPPPQVSPDGTVALVPVPLDVTGGDEAVAEQVDALRETLLDARPDGVELEVTGGPAFTTDLTKVFEGADVRLLAFTAAVVAVLLLVTYRSPFLWVVPLVVVALAEQTTLRLVEQVLPRLDLQSDGAVTGITSVLVFGAATNYALLLISRYREQLRLRENRFEAMRIALARSGEAILASGGTVVLSVLTLLLASISFNRALGLANAIGILVAMLTGLVVLPAVLVLFGRWVFWPLVPRVGSTGSEGRVWGRLGEVVARRPRSVAVAGVALLAVLASGGLGLTTGLSASEQFREKPEAVTALETLSTAFPAGASGPLAVMTTPDEVDEVVRTASGVEGVASARPGEIAGDVAPGDVVLEAEPGSEASFEAVRDLRESLAPAGALVGGEVASDLDRKDAEARDRAVVIPLVLVLVLAVLVVLLRSLVAPVLLVATVVASYFASLGASWLLFTTVLDFPALDPGVLLLSFLFLVALGVDYNIFLVTRAREEAAHIGTRPGMLVALRVTGGVITSAGVLLAAVFAVLGVLPLITLTQIGIIVCVGVLLDTLLVRTVVVPALVFVLGDRFWLPSRPAARLDEDGEPVAAQPVPARP